MDPKAMRVRQLSKDHQSERTFKSTAALPPAKRQGSRSHAMTPSTELVVPKELAAKYADRGSAQWVYGEISSAEELLALLRSATGGPRPDELLLDFGSGDGGPKASMEERGLGQLHDAGGQSAHHRLTANYLNPNRQ